MSPTSQALRSPSLIEFSRHPLLAPTGSRRWTARGQNFAVTHLESTADGAASVFSSHDELMLITLDGVTSLTGAHQTVQAPARSICILPASRWEVSASQTGRYVLIQSLREDEDAPEAVNRDAYAPRDARIVPVGRPYVRLVNTGQVQVLAIDQVKAPADKARLKMLQTSTLSINWVEYEGPRDRSQLSPHSHAAFEQGSLGLEGDFLHHLRTPWGENAGLWQDDQHARLASPSLMVVPVGLVHTSEGVGPGRHLLIDVFSPPRADFIAKTWVANAADYAPPQDAA